jgi:hypothetical protein
VICDSAEDVSAVCDCEDEGCEKFIVRAEDLIVYALNIVVLAEAVRRAFAFDGCEAAGYAELQSRLVGTWGVRRSPVFFYIPISGSGTLAEVDRVCAAVPDPFILMTPTSRFCTPMVLRALRRHGSVQLALAGMVALTAPGHLEIIPSQKPSVDLLLGEFAKRVPEGKALERAVARMEAKLDALAKRSLEERPETDGMTESVARQAFGLVRKLDEEEGARKPSLLTVLRLYCVDNLSVRQIARKSGCSIGTVMNRLQTLAQKIGVRPETLRAYSAQFERMEEELSESRAREIYRKGQADGGEDEDESLD